MEVTLQQVLDAREQRAFTQFRLGQQYGLPLISFSMNIPGPVKYTPMIHNAFAEGCAQLETALDAARCPVRHSERREAVTGCEAFYVVDASPERVKAVTTDLEDQLPLGRLYDMDVLLADGTKLDRELVAGGPRCCIVCGAPGKGCASRRVHTVAELQKATAHILERGLDDLRRTRIAALAVRSLLDEVCITPKPGLVDRKNSGSHRDMDIFTFMASAAALQPYFLECAAIGQRTRDAVPETVFPLLRAAGKQADRDMLLATGGINTHKGAIYTMGILCGAAGRLLTPEQSALQPEALLDACAQLAGPATKADFAAMEAGEAVTAGQKLYREHGIRGIRGQVADGLPALREIALPTLRRELKRTRSLNDAGVLTLLQLIAQVEDTNLIARGGLAGAAEAKALVQALEEPVTLDAVRQLNDEFVQRRLSPGGCADLLAAAIFVHLLCPEPEITS